MHASQRNSREEDSEYKQDSTICPPTQISQRQSIAPTYVRNPKDGQIVWIVEFLSVNEMTDHAFAIVDLPVALSSGIVLIHVKVGSPSYETVVHEVWQ